MNPKVIEWLKRYIPAEMFAIVGTLVGGLIAHQLFHNAVVTAVVSTWSENVGFYGRIVYRDVMDRRKKDQKVTLAGMLKVLRNVFVEFGPAEYGDSFFIRPLAMYFIPLWIGNLALGLVIAKFAADISFYFPTIIFYELRKKYLKD